MKKKSILSLFICLLGFGISTTSCEDMLTPEMDRYAEGFTGTDTVNFYLGILANVQDVVEQNILLAEMRSDLVDTTMYASDSVADIVNFEKVPDGENELLSRAAYYKVINQCNFYLSRVDSMASKNGIYYMRKEMAQVLLIRAWTYMQLVQQYGTVPFITEPVSSANTGLETNPSAWATPDNLLDLLRADCEQALAYEKTYGRPSYGNYNTGSVTVSSSLLLFPANIVLGDLYLLRGASTQDYVQAARHYYDYLSQSNAGLVSYGFHGSYIKRENTSGGVMNESYTPSVSSWSSLYRTSAQSSNELITVIPSAANSYFGTVLTRIPQIYGFDPSSSNVTSSEENDDESATTSGTISVKANYKNRQIQGSAKFQMLNKSQDYAYIETQDGLVSSVTYIDNGDCRYFGTVPEVRTSDGRFRFMQKFCGSSASDGSVNNVSGFTFRYLIGIYRTRQVYLRFAEALNRAGYPRHAYAVLRGGLNASKFPAELSYTYEYNDADSTRKPIYAVDSTAYDPDYMTIDELRRARADANYAYMLDFTAARWTNVGIHDLGCLRANVSADGIDRMYYQADTLNSYEYRVGQRIIDEASRRGDNAGSVRRYGQMLKKHAFQLFDDDDTTTAEDSARLDSLRATYTVLEADDPAAVNALEIDAVESLIADECALETGFEGYRLFDLMRIARHKNADNTAELGADYAGTLPADNGTSWFAWQIARRNVQYKLYENPTVYNSTLYNMLLNTDNWYLQNPTY